MSITGGGEWEAQETGSGDPEECEGPHARKHGEEQEQEPGSRREPGIRRTRMDVPAPAPKAFHGDEAHRSARPRRPQCPGSVAAGGSGPDRRSPSARFGPAGPYRAESRWKSESPWTCRPIPGVESLATPMGPGRAADRSGAAVPAVAAFRKIVDPGRSDRDVSSRSLSSVGPCTREPCTREEG